MPYGKGYPKGYSSNKGKDGVSFKEEWPRVVKETYASGGKPKAMPTSNHNTEYHPTVYKSSYDATKGVAMMPNKKISEVGGSSKMQPPELKGYAKEEAMPATSLGQALKENKYAA